MTMVTGIDPLRPFASIIIPNKNAPKVVPIYYTELSYNSAVYYTMIALYIIHDLIGDL